MHLLNFFFSRPFQYGISGAHWNLIKTCLSLTQNGQTFKKPGLDPMPESNPPSLLPALKSIDQLLKEDDVEGIIIGGMAVSLLGRPRYTNDIDLVILDLDERLNEFIIKLKRFGIEPRIDNVEDFALKSRVLLMRHTESGINIDISMGILPFEIDAVARRNVKSYSGLELALPTPEDLIIFKSVASRQKDIEDIKVIVSRHSDLDKDYVLSRVKEFSEILDRIEIYNNIEKLLI
jgi:predicted nucleotidyltransferase